MFPSPSGTFLLSIQIADMFESGEINVSVPTGDFSFIYGDFDDNGMRVHLFPSPPGTFLLSI